MNYLIKINVLDVCGLDPQNDIDKLKQECETYQEYMKKFDEGVQMKWN